MSEKTNEILVPVPISLLRKASRYDRSMKKILGKFAKENNLPGSSKEFQPSTNHNEEYELEEKELKLKEEQEEIAEFEAKMNKKLGPVKANTDKLAEEKSKETLKVNNASANKKRS